jgi:hypothetical protein
MLVCGTKKKRVQSRKRRSRDFDACPDTNLLATSTAPDLRGDGTVGTAFQLEANAFWDDRKQENFRVVFRLTTED